MLECYDHIVYRHGIPAISELPKFPDIRPTSSGSCGYHTITTGLTTGTYWYMHITPFKTAPTFEVWSQWRESENE